MRIIILAVSATSLLAIGAALSLQAGRPSTASLPTVAEATSPAPSARVANPEGPVNSEVADAAATAMTLPAEQPTSATVVRVKTIRIEPELPPARADDQHQVPPSAESNEQQVASTGEKSDAVPVAPSSAAPMPQTHTAKIGRNKPPLTVAKRFAHAKRKPKAPADDPLASDSLSYAPKEPGPESLNPLGRLLTGKSP